MNNEKDKQSADSIISQQQAIGKAINEHIKEEQGDEKINPALANNSKNRNRQSNAGQKKVGGGKQKKYRHVVRNNPFYIAVHFVLPLFVPMENVSFY